MCLHQGVVSMFVKLPKGYSEDSSPVFTVNTLCGPLDRRALFVYGHSDMTK